MKTLYAGLIAGILTACLIVVLQVSYILRQASNSLDHATDMVVQNGLRVAVILNRVDGTLARVDETVKIVRKSADYQVGYYEGIGRRTQNLVAKLEIVVGHLDDRTERITQSVEELAADSGELTAATTEQIEQIGQDTSALLEEARTTVRTLNGLAADPEIKASIEATAQSAASLASATAHADGATANVEEATGYVRDMLKPTKKSFWGRVLGLLIPRPTVSF